MEDNELMNGNNASKHGEAISDPKQKLEMISTISDKPAERTLLLADRVKCRRRESVLLVEADQVGHENLRRCDPQLLLAVEQLRLQHARERARHKVNYGRQLWRTLRYLVKVRGVTSLASSEITANNKPLPPPKESSSQVRKDAEERNDCVQRPHRPKLQQKRPSPDLIRSNQNIRPEVQGEKRMRKETSAGGEPEAASTSSTNDTVTNYKSQPSKNVPESTASKNVRTRFQKKNQQTTTRNIPVPDTKKSNQTRKVRVRKPSLLPPLHVPHNVRGRRVTQPELHELSVALDRAASLSTSSSEPAMRPAASSRHRVWAYNWVPTMHHPGRLPSFYRQLHSVGRRNVRSASSERAERHRLHRTRNEPARRTVSDKL